MMNYKVENTGRMIDVGNGFAMSCADVVETTTNQTIKSNISSTEAKALARHLNLGGGFDGKTPAFFLEAFPLSKGCVDL